LVESAQRNDSANELTAFKINNRVYRLVASHHATDRLFKRKLNQWYVASACIALGEKLDKYNNSGMDIMIVDKEKNTTCIVTVERDTIVLITVLDKGNPYVKKDRVDRTVVEEFGKAS